MTLGFLGGSNILTRVRESSNRKWENKVEVHVPTW